MLHQDANKVPILKGRWEQRLHQGAKKVLTRMETKFTARWEERLQQGANKVPTIISMIIKRIILMILLYFHHRNRSWKTNCFLSSFSGMTAIHDPSSKGFVSIILQRGGNCRRERFSIAVKREKRRQGDGGCRIRSLHLRIPKHL